MIKPADVLFCWGYSLIDKGIECVTNGPSHCAMFLDENTLIEAQVGREVGKQSLSFYLDKGCRLEVWADTSLTDAERQQMVEYALSLHGTPYDYLLIPIEALRFLGANTDWYIENSHLICSTFLTKVANHVKRTWSKELNPAPVDLMNGGVLTKGDENGF